MYYMAYGLFGILMKWAKGGYSETPQELAKIVTKKMGAGMVSDFSSMN